MRYSIKKIVFSFSILILLLLKPKVLYADEQKHDEILFSFAVIGHTHSMPDIYTQFLKMQETLDTRFIIVLGDFIKGNDHKQEWKKLQEYHERYLKIPAHFIPGNHEITNKSKFAREFYIENIGKLNYSFVYGGVKFILISSFDTGGEDSFPPIQFLEEELNPSDSSNYVHKLLFLHHALWFSQNDIYSNNPNSSDVTSRIWNNNILPLVKKSGIKYVFSGDAGGYSYYKDNGINYILNGLPATNYSLYYPLALKVDVFKDVLEINLIQFELDAYDTRYQDHGKIKVPKNSFHYHFTNLINYIKTSISLLLSPKRIVLIFLIINIGFGTAIYMRLKRNE